MAGKKTYILKPLGLNTASNPIALPSGAMLKALDVSLDRDGIVESRQTFYTNNIATVTPSAPATGFDAPFATPLGGSGNVYQYSTKTFRSGGYWDGTAPQYGLYSVGNGATGIGTGVVQLQTQGVASPGSMPLGPITGLFSANGNDYMLGQSLNPYSQAVGIGNSWQQASAAYRIDPVTLISRNNGAGMAEALAPIMFQSAVAVTSVSGVTIPSTTPISNQLNSGLQCAYRILYASKDGQQNLVRGVPSGRLIAYGPTNAYGLFIPLPGQFVGLFAGDILQVYRSEIVSTGSTEPSDEMRQVWEYIITPTDVTRGWVVFPNDVTPSGYGGAALYTNDSQQGVSMAEARPPNCTHGEYFKSVAWYGGVVAKGQSLLMSFIGLNGWAIGNTFTLTMSGFGSFTYTAGAAENLTSSTFLLDTTSPTPALRAFNTARSLANTISYKNSFLYAVYSTAPNDVTPSVVFKCARTDYIGAITVSSTVPPGTTAPSLTTAATMVVGGKSNYLYYSKPNQPEAVPDLSYVQIGAPGSSILGMKSLHDSLFIFKAEGLFRLTGSDAATIRVELFDPTIHMNPGGHKSIAAGGNRIFALCNLGVVSIIESGAKIVSLPIDDIMSLYKVSANDGSIFSVSISPYFAQGAASETRQCYYLLLTDKINATTTTQRLMIYNYRLNIWYEWTPPFPNATTGLCVNTVQTFNAAYENIRFNGDSSFSASIMSPLVQIPGYNENLSFSYCLDSGEAPDVLQSFDWVKIVTVDSVNISDGFDFTFSSDVPGSTPETLHVPCSAKPGIVQCAVPRNHARCNQLTVTVSKTPGTFDSSRKFVCYGMVVGYDDASDWMNSRNNQ